MNTNNDTFRESSTKSNMKCNISDKSCWIYCTCVNDVYLIYIYTSIINISFIIINSNNDKCRAFSTKSNMKCKICEISCSNVVYLVYIYIYTSIIHIFEYIYIYSIIIFVKYNIYLD